MSVRVNASGDYLQYADAALPDQNIFSLMGWFQRLAGGGPAMTLFSAFDTAGYNAGEWSIYRQGGTNQYLLYMNGNTAARILGSYAVNDWFFSAITVNGTGPGSVLVYDGAYGDVLNVYASVNRGIVGTNDRFQLLNATHYGEWFNGRGSTFKCYSGVVLTQGDLELEMAQMAPYVRTGIFSYIRNNNILGSDFSGNERDMTVGGTLTLEEDPDVPEGSLNAVADLLALNMVVYSATATTHGVTPIVATTVIEAGSNLAVVIKTVNVGPGIVELFTANLETCQITSDLIPERMCEIMSERYALLKPLFDQDIPGFGGGPAWTILQDQILKALFSMGAFGGSTLGSNDLPSVSADINSETQTAVMQLYDLSETADYPEWFLFTIPHSVSPLFTLCGTAAFSNVPPA